MNCTELFSRGRTCRTLLAGIVVVLSMWGCSSDSRKNKGSPAPKSQVLLVHHRVPVEGNYTLTPVDSRIKLEAAGTDDFGSIYRIEGPGQAIELVLKEGEDELERYTVSTEPERSASTEPTRVWIFGGSTRVYREAPPVIPNGPTELAVYFVPKAGDEEGWGLHVWDAERNVSWTNWERPLAMDSHPIYGSYVRLTLPPNGGYSAAPGAYERLPQRLGLIVQRSGEKAVNEDILAAPQQNGILFLTAGTAEIFCTPDLKPCGWKGQLAGTSAHWVRKNELLWKPKVSNAARYALVSSLEGRLDFATLSSDIASAESTSLTPAVAISESVQEQFPHLRSLRSFRLEPQDLDRLVRSELMVAALNAQGKVVEATRVQLAGVLDEAYATDQDLGLVLGPQAELRVWAPTAQNVTLQIYGSDKQLLSSEVMKQNRGLWSAPVRREWVEQRLYYRFAMQVFHPRSGLIERYEVTDPYSVSLARNSKYSQFVDINAADLKPAGWDSLRKAPIPPTDMSIAEFHVRDFSIADRTVPKALRGTYRAFTLNGLDGRPESLGMRHLRGLQGAGLTHVQILPSYDFATVNEDPDQRLDLDESFSELCKGLDFAQDYCASFGSRTIEEAFLAIPKTDDTVTRLNSVLAKKDGYNWGYDPFHYGVPEGSFASEPEGAARIREFREMVQALGEVGLHFAIDVVYNHTFSSGLFDQSVLDKVVPGYYHRLNAVTGGVENSTCCENTATEHRMMEKLMIDTLVRWVDDYKVDAFRFDLMGHHMKSNLLKAKEVLGDRVYIYGEGWNFGEVADNRRGVNATQFNMAGTGIATFNDRLRDAVRGGGAFDCGFLLYQQGPVNGLVSDDNERGSFVRNAKDSADCAVQEDFTDRTPEEKLGRALQQQDRIRLGLAGTLRNYPLVTAQGEQVLGVNLETPDSRLGYNLDAGETINYVQNHDNQTYWDINQIKLPFDLSLDERVRVHNLGISINFLAMGVPYFELGTEILRSKSLVRDTFDSGDWINQIDWTLETHNWNRGLPPAEKEQSNLAALRIVKDNVPGAPSKAQMQRAYNHFRELLRIRLSTPLFRLSKADEIISRLDFLPGTENQPGVIVMRLSDEVCGQTDLDAKVSEILVVFNMRPEAVGLNYPKALELHPEQRGSDDERLKNIAARDGSLLIPGRTTAVFVEPQGSARAAIPSVCRPVGSLSQI